MREITEKEALIGTQKRKENKEEMRREAIRGMTAEEEKGVRARETRTMVVSNVANRVTLPLSVIRKT